MKSLIPMSILIMLSATGTTYADESEPAGSWQMSRLFHPTEMDIVREHKGKVMIYDGLTDKTVDKALDENFDRMGSFMFTRTIVTDDAGIPLRDPETGEIIIEEDGCD